MRTGLRNSAKIEETYLSVLNETDTLNLYCHPLLPHLQLALQTACLTRCIRLYPRLDIRKHRHRLVWKLFSARVTYSGDWLKFWRTATVPSIFEEPLARTANEKLFCSSLISSRADCVTYIYTQKSHRVNQHGLVFVRTATGPVSELKGTRVRLQIRLLLICLMINERFFISAVGSRSAPFICSVWPSICRNGSCCCCRRLLQW